MATYTCKFCGYRSGNAGNVSSYCSKSPHKSHEWMNATEKLSQYTCKYCGYQSGNAGNAGSHCSKSPYKQHEWLG